MRCEIYSSSESVMPGHPDKLSDQISDAVLDEYLRLDANARVAIEAMVTSNKIIVSGEVNARASISADSLVATVRQVVRDAGYVDSQFNSQDVAVELLINSQSQELSSVVGSDDIRSAGDQSIVFGYASSENDSYVPTAAFYANMILQDIYFDVRSGVLPKLGPDGKILVNINYDRGLPVGVDSIVLALQHDKDINLQEIRAEMFQYVSSRLPTEWLRNDRFFFNMSGSFCVGGPVADTGLTGRKIIADACGAGIPSGGGAFSGKDASKVDRSGAYMARHLAKNVVVSGIADKCLIKMVYCIGMPEPIAFAVDTMGTGRLEDDALAKRLRNIVDLTPSGIFDKLALGRPIYKDSSVFGHFGRPGFPWEDICPLLMRDLT